MSDIDARSAVPALWKRAPLWRLAVFSAALLTLVFFLFPPHADRQPRSLAALSAASYTPPRIENPAPPPVATAQAVAQAAPAAAVPAPAKAAPAKPSAAELSMVTASGSGTPNATGLDPALTGRLYTGAIFINGFEAPLPQGQWMILAQQRQQRPPITATATYLGRIKNKRLLGVVRIVTGRGGVALQTPVECMRSVPILFTVKVEGDFIPGKQEACWRMGGYYATDLQRWADRSVRMPSLERAAAGDLAAKGVSYPQDFIAIAFTREDPTHGLEATYFFSPEEAGINSRTVTSLADSDWTPARISSSPEKMAYVAGLEAWAESFWPKFKDVFAKGATTPSSN